MSKPIVLIAEELSPATVDALGPDFDIRNVDGTDRPALLAALADASAILVRSATKVDAEAIAAAPKLKVIARAGVGLDNVDIKSADHRGRHGRERADLEHHLGRGADRRPHPEPRPPHPGRAPLAPTQGEWKRSKFTGIELYEKTVGIIGLGRIGALIAARLAGFGVKRHRLRPLRHRRPRPAARRATGQPRRSCSTQSDFITIHMPKTPETIGMIGDRAVRADQADVAHRQRRRGGLIDEDALYQALSSKRIAGAGARRLRERAADRVAAARPRQRQSSRRTWAPRPTRRRRRPASRSRRSVRLALDGELVPDAVNVAGGVIDTDVRPGIPLMEKLGQVFAASRTARSPASTSRCAARSPNSTSAC